MQFRIADTSNDSLANLGGDKNMCLSQGSAALSTMHFAKGLEFLAVVVMACDDEIIPSQQRIERVTDNADLEEVYETERHLLYVACTRARDRLLITSGELSSEFLEDMSAPGTQNS